MRAWTASALAFLITLVTFAGCLDGEIDVDGPMIGPDGMTPVDALGRPIIPPDWFERVFENEPGHDHTLAAHHEGRTTANFHIVGYNPLATDWHGGTSGDYFCHNLVETDGRALSVVHSFGSDVAFVLSDVTDPANPRKLGELVMENSQVYDLSLTPDQRYVVLATSPMVGPDMEPDSPGPPMLAGAAPLLPGSMFFRDACTGDEIPLMGPEAGLPFASGAVLVNIENPRNPYVADFRMFPVMGSHSIRAHDVDGETLLLSSVPNPAGPASYYVFMGIEDSPTGGLLTLHSVYQWYPDGPMGPAGASGMHDGYIQRHPATGEVLAYLAYGGQGLVIVNVDDPSNPEFRSHWADWSVVGEAGEQISHYMHGALPTYELWDGRHYTFIGEECGGRTEAAPSCLLYTLDTTDPANPEFVGAWTLPYDVQWENALQYSLHYFALVDRTLFVTAYHGGVWAIDVSSPDALRAMPSIGAFMPVNESPYDLGYTPRSAVVNQMFAGYGLENRPTILDVQAMRDGTLIVYDGQSGLYTVRFDATHRAPPPPLWPLGYNEDILTLFSE